MRILFVTPYVPSQVRIRPLALIRELASAGHQITLACLVQPAREAPFLSEVTRYCEAVHPVTIDRRAPIWRALSAIPGKQPLSVAYCQSPAFIEKVRSLFSSGEFDLLHTEFIRAAPVTKDLTGLPKLFDAVDSMALVYRRSTVARRVPLSQRLVSLVEWRRMHQYEPEMMRCFDHVLVSSPADQEELLAEMQDMPVPISVLPNGVDTQFFRFVEADRDEDHIVFLGKMDYYVNVSSVLWFYHEIFPHIRREHPNVRLTIIGRDPSPSILSLARTDPAVTVTGTVPDVRPILEKATLSICPMVSGAGIQNKMLEAMSSGLPTVATSLACHALKVQSGQNVLAANTTGDFAQAVLELLDDPIWRKQLAAGGRQYVEQHHNWTEIGKQLQSIYTRLAAASPGSTEESRQPVAQPILNNPS